MSQRDASPVIRTYLWQAFNPLDPDPECILIEDIARSLSNLCRYNGHVREFYCPTPEQRVLTADLRWVPAIDLKVGSGSGYLSNVAPALRAFFLERGLLLRPLGNTTYLMPPYCISPQQTDQIFDAIEAAAKQFGG